MKFNIKFIVLATAIIYVHSGCKKYLDIQPEDQYTEEQVFSSENSAQQALNGIYMNLAGNRLYGANLSNTLIELLGQRYTADPASVNEYIVKLNYVNPSVSPLFDALWKEAYTTILKTNKFISSSQQAMGNGVLSQRQTAIVSGEAIAIRAMLHFDILRLFGPVPNTAGMGLESIPYYKEANGRVQPLLKTSVALDTIIADLRDAAELLKQDAVIVNGVDTASKEFYTGDRQFRFNYYGVKTLLARVYLYANKKTEAYNTAKEILNDVDAKFPWMPYAQILTAGNNPDRIFSPEVITGIENRNMYTTFNLYFAPTVITGLLVPLDGRLNSTFENNINDYRFTSTWLMGPRNFRTFYKFADVADQRKHWRFMQPLLRKTELYYILAETETDLTKALGYLNTVRFNRGLPNLTSTSTLTTQIGNEYMKEFFGEGQLFFYYKRKASAIIPSGLSNTSSIFSPNFRVPLPESETYLR